MASILNVNELIGTSYYYLRQYFGNEIKDETYQIPQALQEKINKEEKDTFTRMNESDEYADEEIIGTQAVGNTILKNTNDETVAELLMTELPTPFSSMPTSSVGLKLVYGNIVENKELPTVPVAPLNKEPLMVKSTLIAPEPLKVVAPEPVKVVAPEPLKVIAPEEVKKPSTEPANPLTPEEVKKPSPGSVTPEETDETLAGPVGNPSDVKIKEEELNKLLMKEVCNKDKMNELIEQGADVNA